MAASGTISVTGIMNGFDQNAYSITIGQISINLTNVIGEVRSVVLASGNNTILVPAGTQAMFVQPPANNLTSITIKGDNNDTGMHLNNVYGSFITFGTPAPTQFVMAAGSTMSAPVKLIFM